jgi:hypothetical protein
VADEAKWRIEWEQAGNPGALGGRAAKRICQTQHPHITDMMDLWVSKAMSDGILLTGEVLRQKWTRFANLAGIPEDERISLSDGWLMRFKKRAGLKELKRHGEAASADPVAASADPVAAEQDRARIQELILEYGYELRNIFNMDETGLFYA